MEYSKIDRKLKIKVFKHPLYHYNFEDVLRFFDVNYVNSEAECDYVTLAKSCESNIFKNVNKPAIYSYIREIASYDDPQLIKQFTTDKTDIQVFALSDFNIFKKDIKTHIFEQFELDAFFRLFVLKTDTPAKKIADTKTFLFLGGKPNKPHRLPLYNILKDSNIEKNGICQLHQMLPSPDKQAINVNHYLGYPYETWLYEKTKISLISETFFSEGQPIFCTEKTYRAIANCHPFVIAASPYHLDYLRSRGYETFSSLIDESYDTMLPLDIHGTADDSNRLQAIVKSLKEAMEVPADKYKEICRHNQSVLINNSIRTLQELKTILNG